MKDLKELKKNILLLSYVHKKRYYLLISTVLSCLMFFVFYLYIEAHIGVVVFGLFLVIILGIFGFNTLAYNFIKEFSKSPYVLTMSENKVDMENFSIETNSKRKVFTGGVITSYYLYQKRLNRYSGHIPSLTYLQDAPRILMPSIVGSEIYTNYYVNIYNYQNNEFNMTYYKNDFDKSRIYLQKENMFCNSVILDVIIVDKINGELSFYLNNYINNYLFEPCLFVVVCSGKIYVPPISKDITYEYQLDAYKDMVNYIKETLL